MNPSGVDDAMNELAIGVDIGHTNIRAAAVVSGRPVEVLRERTDLAGGAPGVLDQAAGLVRRLDPGGGARVGVGIAGQCDLSAGVVRRGPNLFWPDVPFRDLLAERLGVPVVLRNDVVMATAGEWRQGAGRGASDLVCLFVGTGIGGGAVAGGRLVDGSSGLAGHFGHISVDLNGPRCTCGRTGCVEAYAGGDNVAAQVRRELSRDRERSPVLMEMCGGDLEVLSSRMVAQAVSKGDAYSVSVRDRMAAALSSAVASVINSFNPGTVVLGGTVLFGFPGLADMVITGATEQCLGPARRGLSIVPSALGDLAGAIGAAAMALETYG